MKKILPVILTTVLSFGSFTAVQAGGVQCPTVQAIQSKKVTEVLEYLPGLFMAMEEDEYGTKQDWRFNLGPVSAKNKREVLRKANREIAELSGPIRSTSEGGDILCVYRTGNPANSAIATPADDE